jgi:hypothetical protein
MATGAEVLSKLIPSGGWVITGDDFDSIRYDDGVSPITKKQFDDGFAAYDDWKANREAEIQNRREALFTRIGITADEAALLLG